MSDSEEESESEESEESELEESEEEVESESEESEPEESEEEVESESEESEPEESEEVEPETEIRPIKRQKIKHSTLDIYVTDSCTICLEQYRGKESICVLDSCSHIFHSACVNPWINQLKGCPICRV